MSDGGADDSAPTPAQTLLHTLNKGGPEASFAAWGANALLTQTAADGLPGEFSSLLETFRNGRPTVGDEPILVADASDITGGTKTDAGDGTLLAASKGADKDVLKKDNNDTAPFEIKQISKQEYEQMRLGLEQRRSYDEARCSREISALSPRKRAIAALAFDQKFHGSPPSSVMDSSDMRQALLLSGTPPEVVRRVLSDPITNYEKLRESIRLDMLPFSLRQETEQLQRQAQAWADKNGNKLTGAFSQWQNPDGQSSVEPVVQEVFNNLNSEFGEGKLRVTMLPNAPKGAPPIWSDGRQLLVNTAHPFFQERTPERFCDMAGAVLHEMIHIRQVTMARQTMGDNDERLAGDPLTINRLTYIPYDESRDNRAYLLQPIELQAHFVHNALRQNLRKRFS